jgi:hypothetical protein
MKLEPFTDSGSTPKRRRFWNEVRAAVISSTKLAGRHVSVDEHPGKGSVINVYDTSARRTGPAPPIGGACCCIDVGGSVCQDGSTGITTEADCITYCGAMTPLWSPGATCYPTTGSDCAGACCIGGVCYCASEANCISGGGLYLGDGTICDPFPC